MRVKKDDTVVVIAGKIKVKKVKLLLFYQNKIK